MSNTPHADKAIRAIRWIQKYCVMPDGPDGGRRPGSKNFGSCILALCLMGTRRSPATWRLTSCSIISVVLRR
jgi:hypothetical protein